MPTTPIKPSQAQLEETRERLLYMHCEYRHYMNNDERELGSAGMVPSYSFMPSGKTNRTSDLTAMQAMRLANIPPEKLTSLRWIDCAWKVFLRGTTAALDREKPRINERRNRAAVAYVLYHKAFLGCTFQRIAEMGLPDGSKVSRQRIYDFWELATKEVALEAMKAGLL